MRPSLALFSLLLATLTSRAAPIITAGPSLTEQTWSDVDEGIWLVEHYSPYCGHCKQFAPTWRDLVDAYAKPGLLHQFHFAQVDCVANGDLCNKNGVAYYPSIYLYKGGVKEEEYKGARTIEALGKWVEEKWAPEVVAEEGPQLPEDDEEVEPDEDEGGAPRSEKDEEDDEDEKDLHVLKVVDDAAVTAGFIDLLTPTATQSTDDSAPVKPQRQPPPAPKPPPPKQNKPVKPGPPVGFVKQPYSEHEEKRRSKDREKVDQAAESGVVNLLTVDDVQGLRDGTMGGPAFVKFYAPWCTHCKALAPLWAKLAEALKSQVAVYEVDCEGTTTAAACKLEKVKSYPTLFFYNDGVKVEYKGKRNVESMKAFALKAASATVIKSLANEYELKRVTSTEDVVFLFLHPSDASAEDLTLAKDASTSLLGGPSFYTSSSPDLFHLFSVTSTPTLLVFKEHLLTPASTFTLPASSLSSSSRLSLTQDWIRVAKLSLLTELSGSTFYDLMPSTFSKSSTPPLVALAVLSPSRLGSEFERTKAEVESMARGWSVRTKASEGASGVGRRQVLWSWIDGDRWAGWAKSLYGVSAKGDPILVVADPKAMEYWRTSLEGESLSIGGSGSADAAYKLIEEGIFGGSVKGESSKNYVERWGDRITKSSTTILSGVVNHPFMTILALAVGGGLGVLVIKWLNAPLPGGGGTNSGPGLYTKYE